MSGFKMQKWLTRGATDIVIAPNESDKTNPPDRQPVRPIAQTYGQGIDENMANARLIAAAPEMYELLEVWVNLQAQPTLMEARKRAQELLVRIDGTEAGND